MTPQNERQGMVTAREPLRGETGRLLTNSARNALALIARSLLPHRSRILVPSYHCPSLVAPLLWAECDILFYDISESFTPVESDFLAQAKSADAVLLVRYFGFDCQANKFARLAREAGCYVIEDLAHAAYARQLYGDVGVTSLKKFYPVDDGSEIIYSSQEERQKLGFEIARHSRKSPALRVTRLLRSMASKFGASALPQHFDPLSLDRSSTVWQFSDINPEEAIQRRRSNYSAIAHALEESGLAEPIFKKLPEGAVPYVCPAMAVSSDVFQSVRARGVPVYRWEEFAYIANRRIESWRELLLQFPCHEELGAEDISTLGNLLHEARLSLEPA